MVPTLFATTAAANVYLLLAIAVVRPDSPWIGRVWRHRLLLEQDATDGLLVLVAHRGLAGLCGWTEEQEHGIAANLARAAMFLCTLYGWMLFRVTDVDRIVAYTAALFSAWSASFLGALVFAQMAVFIVMALVIDAVEVRLVIPARHKLRAGPWLAPAYATMFAVILVFIASVSGEFIYFKF